jgi:hypothetical protein
MERVREALFRWISGVMEERGWSAAAWARYAEVTPTNLTRFLRNPETASLPSAETIGRLAWAAGREPRFLSDGPNTEVCRIPILMPEQVRTLLTLNHAQVKDFIHEALRDNGQCIAIEQRPSPCAFGLQITSHHMNAGGLLPEDQIVVEPIDLLPPRQGDLIVAIDGSMVCGYRYFPPYLVPTSTDSTCCPIAHDGATVAGVAIHVTRSLYH